MSNGKIEVHNKRIHVACPADFYVGRPSPLGNPFSHLQGKTLAKFIVATRDEAVAKYREYAKEQYDTDAAFKAALDGLVVKHKSGEDLHLICWCYPSACHGQVLKEMIEELSNDSQR